MTRTRIGNRRAFCRCLPLHLPSEQGHDGPRHFPRGIHIRLAHRSFSAQPLTGVHAVNDNRRELSWWGHSDPLEFVVGIMIAQAFQISANQAPRTISFPEVGSTATRHLASRRLTLHETADRQSTV